MTDPTGYESLADMLRQQITAGQLPPGALLPSEATLAQRFGLARDTVRRAVTVLRYEGLVQVRHGYGVMVFDRGEVVDVEVPAGSVIESRPPNPAERRDHGVPDGWSVIVVERPDGEVSVYPAHRYQIRAAGSL